MNELIPLAFESQPFKVMDRDGNPWFAASDMGNILGLKNAKKNIATFPESERSIVTTSYYGKSGKKVPHKILIINLSGLFRLIFQSRKPESERFKDFILKHFVSNAFHVWKNPKSLPLPGSLQGGCYPAVWGTRNE